MNFYGKYSGYFMFKQKRYMSAYVIFLLLIILACIAVAKKSSLHKIIIIIKSKM